MISENQNIKENENKIEKKCVNDNFCFICYEISNKREKKPKKLKNQKLYIKTCECDGLIHNECLKIWFLQSKKCPICREIMLQKNQLVALIVNISNNNNDNDNDTNALIQNNNNNNTLIENNRGIRMTIYLYIQKHWFKIAKIINIVGIIITIIYIIQNV